MQRDARRSPETASWLDLFPLGHSVLHVGSQPHLTEALARRADRVLATRDALPPTPRHGAAMEAAERVEAVAGAPHDLALPEGAVDTVVLTDGARSAGAGWGALDEARRVLHPGGGLVAATTRRRGHSPRRAMAARGFRVDAAYTLLPGLDAPQVVLPEDADTRDAARLAVDALDPPPHRRAALHAAGWLGLLHRLAPARVLVASRGIDS